MTALLNSGTVSAKPVNAPSEYAPLLPKLRQYAAMPASDPQHRVLREELILAFLPVAGHVARKHANDSSSVEELTQIGTVALITAIDRWNPQLASGEFLGYLIPCVRGEILRWFRDRTWSMRVPRGLKDLSVAIGRASGPLSDELGRAPRPSELADCLGVGVEQVIEALDARASYQAGTLDSVDPRTGIAVIERLGGLDTELEKFEDRQALCPLLDRLSEQERTVVTLRFFREMTQTHIAQEIGISQMHVSRILARSLQKLRAGAADGSETD